jgi:hypothetical protein
MLSKIRTASTLGGQLWIKELPGYKPWVVSSNLFALVSSLFSLLWACLAAGRAYYSVVFDVLANFLRLSVSLSLVNSFFIFLFEIFFEKNDQPC